MTIAPSEIDEIARHFGEAFELAALAMANWSRDDVEKFLEDSRARLHAEMLDNFPTVDREIITQAIDAGIDRVRRRTETLSHLQRGRA